MARHWLPSAEPTRPALGAGGKGESGGQGGGGQHPARARPSNRGGRARLGRAEAPGSANVAATPTLPALPRRPGRAGEETPFGRVRAVGRGARRMNSGLAGGPLAERPAWCQAAASEARDQLPFLGSCKLRRRPRSRSLRRSASLTPLVVRFRFPADMCTRCAGVGSSVGEAAPRWRVHFRALLAIVPARALRARTSTGLLSNQCRVPAPAAPRRHPAAWWRYVPVRR